MTMSPNTTILLSHQHGANALAVLPPAASTLFKAAVLAVLLISPLASSVAQAAPRAKPHIFKVGKRSFEGRAETICTIEGRWADGEYFRYQGWDACAKMRISSASLANYKGWAPCGRKGSLTVADIPPKAETIEISNDVSSVLVFRDQNGIMQEVLIRD